MVSETSISANRQNALKSTGPKTSAGKAIIATNAIKHGIFTKDLIIKSTLGKEDEGEYLEMLKNLFECLTPQNQMESLLVEKIAIDFWRLRRVIRFEAGSIGKYLEEIFKEFYSYGKKRNKEIDIEIQRTKDTIAWIATYLEHLKKDEVTFDHPLWEGPKIESDILEDFCLIIKTLDGISYEMKEKLLHGAINFAKMKATLAQNGYPSKKELSAKLIEIYTKQIQQLEREIEDSEQKQLINIEADNLNSMLGMIPQEVNTDKILKYERSIQKSIFQNTFLLKKLQGSC